MARDLPTPSHRSPRGPLVLLAAAALGAALGGGALLLAEWLRGPPGTGPAMRGEVRTSPTATEPPTAAGAAPARAPGADGPAITWRCPMHPDVARDRPGACPICGMPLVKDAGPERPR